MSERNLSEARTWREKVELARREAQSRGEHDPLRVLSEEVARLRIRSVGSQEDSEGAGRYFELLRLVDAMGEKAIREGIGNCVREMRALLAEYHRLTAEEQN